MSPVYATRALLDVLCELAADADPDSLSVRLAATPAGDLQPTSDADGRTDSDGGTPSGGTVDALADIDPGTPILSDFYFPAAGDALTKVFGVDLATPAGQTAGRFASHPRGDPDVSLTDDFHAHVLVAVPPWTPADVRAYDRSDTRQDLVVVDAETPEPDAPS